MPNTSCQSISKNRNTTLPIGRKAAKNHTKPTDIQNHTTFIALPFRETRTSSTHQITGTGPPKQEPSQATVPTYPWRADFTIKRHYNPLASSLQKGDPKHSKLNKMKKKKKKKKQKNMQQMKEYGKNPWDPTNEREISSLFEKEFRVTIVKMIPSLENTMEE